MLYINIDIKFLGFIRANLVVELTEFDLALILFLCYFFLMINVVLKSQSSQIPPPQNKWSAFIIADTCQKKKNNNNSPMIDSYLTFMFFAYNKIQDPEWPTRKSWETPEHFLLWYDTSICYSI